MLCTNAVSVDQWVYQFKLWTTIADERIGRFTSAAKQWYEGDAGVMVCTYRCVGRQQQDCHQVREPTASILQVQRRTPWTKQVASLCLCGGS